MDSSPVLPQFNQEFVKSCKQTLGSGGFGTIYLCSNGTENTDYVLKKTNDPDNIKGEKAFIEYARININKNPYQHVAEMFNVNTNIHDHNNMVVLKKVDKILSDFKLLNTRSTVDEIYEAIGKQEELNKLTQYNKNSLSPTLQARKMYIIESLIDATKHLHDTVKYVHHDIKPQNVGMDRNEKGGPIIKFIDMGTSKQLNSQVEGSNLESMEYTMSYASRSTISGVYTNILRDKWAVACTIFEIVAGIPLFHLKDRQHIAALVTQIMALNSKTKVDYLLGTPGTFEIGPHPYINDKSIADKHIHTSRWLFGININQYNDENQKIIRDYIRAAFIADIEFDNNKTNTRHKGGKLAKSNNKKKYNGGQNTYNVATDTIKIGNMVEWKKMVDEIKHNIDNDTFYQNIEERPELPSSLIITGAETEQTTVPQYEYDLEDDTENFFENVQLGGKRNYERKPITEKQYLKEKQAPRPNRRVSRHPRKDGTYAYYVKVAK